MKEVQPIECKRFLLESEDEILYAVQLQGDKIAYFYEDAYEQEPWKSGIQVLSIEEFEEKFKIKL